jgi:Organic radical activating enzymes
MVIKGILVEDLINYRVPSMYVSFPTCTFKCDKLNGCHVCQNSDLAQKPNLILMDAEILYNQYASNPITKAIVCCGLEPLDSIDDLIELIETFRFGHGDNSDIVIYTGYTEEEILADKKMSQILQYSNIVVKYGRYIMNDTARFDEVLGVTLASSNQYAKRYNYEN